jgi:DNA-binding NarL/FixJ family response regulator
VPDNQPAAAIATVLTIDDQPHFRAAARELVNATPGFRSVGDAASGREGLALAQTLQPHLVLLDVNLPDIDGIDVCRQLGGRRRAPTVILVSSDDEADYAAEARRCGAVAFVPKQGLTPGRLQAIWQGRERSSDSHDSKDEALHA